MKKIPAPLAPHEINVLIIDRQNLVHESIKNALHQVGITKVQNAQSSYYALRLCAEKRFDMMVISFDVSSDKDGFHLFEELKLKGHITSDTSVIFLSAETSQELVNCIVELQPDDFWVKPLDLKKVETRLQYILNLRSKLHKLLYCLDKKEYSAAIYHAERHLLDPSLKELFPRIKRIVGECLLNLHEFSEAENYYVELLNTYKYGWVSIGLARALLKQDKKEEADFLIDEMLKRDDTRFATYDLLAHYYIEKENYQEAYEQMKVASRLAPRNINRNKKLWDLARLNHDKMGQFQATVNIAKYGKNSIHDSPELSLNVIRAGIDLATTLSPEEGASFIGRAEREMESLKLQKGSMAANREQLSVLKARLLSVRNQKYAAEKVMKDEVSLDNQASLEDNLDKMKAFHELGQKEKSLMILDGLGKQIAGDTFSSHVVTEYLKQESIERREIVFTAKELKDMAAVNYRENRYGPAFHNLRQAFKISPHDKQVAMSMLKVLAQLSKHDRLSEEQYQEAENAYKLVTDTKLSPTQASKRDIYAQELGLLQSKDNQEEQN